jgi:hypothetical protein
VSETQNTTDQWAGPQDVSDLTLAFPTSVDALMPDRAFCEQALRALPDRGRKWVEIQQRWFFHGLPEDTRFDPRKGIATPRALRHLGAIQGSFEPKHEHKEAAVAYLLSRWFTDVRVPKRAKKRKAS